MPDRYLLSLETDAASLRAMTSSGRRIVIAKHRAGSAPQVAWVAFEPTGADTIRWEESYGVYAATSSLAVGRVVRIETSVHPAKDRRIYPFGRGVLGEPSLCEAVPYRHYDVRNRSDAVTTVGRCGGPLSSTAATASTSR